MSVDKYQEMVARVQSNPELAGKVSEYLKKSVQKKAQPRNRVTPAATSNRQRREAAATPTPQ